MQTNLQELENIRTTILSLLLARKGGCTLRQLDNDYCEVEGTHIPWKDLGYTSLLCFLHSMSKNVQIEHKNNTIIIKGIATDKSKHVSKLVAGQKSQTNVVGRKLYKQSHYYPKTAPPKVCVPAEILLDIISLINNHPEGLSKDYVLQVIQAQMPFAHINMQEMEEQFRELSHKIFVTDSKVYPVSNKTKNFDHFVKNNDMYLPDPGSELYNKEEWKSATVVAGGDEDSDDMEDYDDDFSFISTSDTCNKKPATNTKSTSNFIKESVSKCQEQAVEFKKLEQNNLHCLQDYGHNNDSKFCKESPNNVEKRKDHLNSKHGEILINERVKFRLEKLIQSYPNGIWCAELPELYLEEYKISLNYVELGFNSVREFASQLPDIFHCIQPRDTGDFKLYYAKGEIPSDLNTVKQNKKTPLAQLYQIYETDDEGALPLTVSLDVCKQLIPDDTMSIGESVGYISVETLTQNEKPYIEVIVVEVFTPSFFWIQLRKKQKIFQKFMDELHNFYIMKHDRYIVPPVVLEKGLNCACIYNGIWHRGIIKAVNPDLQVTVMFYDYGTLKTYPPESIHYLHKIFSYLPAQAIPCGLINTRPYKGSKWGRSATHHFAIRTQMPLVATVASINAEDNSMMVTLTDTSEEEDVHINDWLVEQKLAEHGKMGDKVEMSNLMLYVEENLLYLPETCYENETTVPDNHNKESTNESINAPLVLPQSTLEGTHFKTAPETEKSQNLSNVNDKNNSTFVNTSAKSYTNPFLEDIPEHNEERLNPKKLMQLWTENLQLQIQIATTMNTFFNKVLIDTEKSNENSLMKDENMNMSSFFQTNDISSTNLTCANMSHVGQDATLLGVNICNESLNINSHSKTFQNPDGHQEAPKKVRVPPGYEKYKNNFKFDEDYFARNVNSGLPTSNDVLNSDTPLKETNPFRLSLAGKLKIPEEGDSSYPFLPSGLHDPQHLTSEYDLILQRFIEKSSFNAKTSTQETTENVCKDILFNQSQHCLNNILSNTNNIQNESIESNWSVDNIANGMSKIGINNQHAQPDVQKSEEIEKNTEQYSFLKTDTKEKKDFNLKSQLSSLTEDQRNEKFTSNYDLNKCEFSAKLPNNNLASSTLINNMNLDEGYFTLPSTSDNTSTSSPLLHLNNDKSEYFQQLWSESEYKFSDTWVKSFQNTVQLNDRNKMNFLFKNNEQTMGGNAGSLVNNESADSQSSCSKGSLLKNIKCMPSEHVVYFQVFELPTGLVHILHYQGEGWLLTDEFIQTFTKFKSTSYAVIFFYICNIHLNYKQIDRTVYPLKFINADSILSKTTQQIMNDKHYIHLVQLKSVVGILDMLEIISKQVSNSVLVNNSVIQDIWFSLQMVNNAYRNLKYYIESAE